MAKEYVFDIHQVASTGRRAPVIMAQGNRQGIAYDAICPYPKERLSPYKYGFGKQGGTTGTASRP